MTHFVQIAKFIIFAVGNDYIPPAVEFGGIGKVGTGAGAGGIGSVINGISLWLLGVSGFIAGLMIVINGIKLMTAGGDGNKIKEAISGIRDAILGFLLALLAAGIVKMLDTMF